ncbi:MAG: pantoate--beta-alanine ligase, partial [Muribaculaceae bacterium]|nr:pantoate--beta-alanine ligase [Muribaculaceae bacterium]
AMRPGHFNGVAQIVSKLFDFTSPTRAYFGEKDFQQIAVIRRMARIEGFDSLEIVSCPIVREADGLALSSRNVRLTPEHRKAAPAIHSILAASVKDANTMSVKDITDMVVTQINAVDGLEVEYYQIVDADTMQPIDSWADTRQAIGCITVYAGDVRLIDNIKY